MSQLPTNIPCARCGAPLREQSTSHLEATVDLRCAFCGAVERLPRAAEARVVALRNLAVERRWAADAATGPAITYLRIVEDPARFIMPYGFAAVIAIASALATPSQWNVIPVGAIGGAAVSAYAAWAIARRHLRRTVAPLVRAFPGAPGRASRCRRCGGELDPHGLALVTCGYCEAPNLLSHGAALERAGQLAAETHDARAYARDTADVVVRAGRFVSRAFRLAFFGGIAIGIGAAWLCAVALR